MIRRRLGVIPVELNVLGPVEVLGVRERIPVRGYKLSKVLGLLALRANQFVSVKALSEELWPDAAPRNETTTIRTHVYNLRKFLESSQAGGPPLMALHTRPMGHHLSVPEELLDIARFHRLVKEGRALWDSARYPEAADRLRTALALWRGEALAGTSLGPVLSGHVTRLAEQRARIRELRIEADMRAGKHRGLVPELLESVATDPSNEWMQARLMEALSRCGRRGEALRSYHGARRRLDDHLGVEPSDDLHRVYLRILTSGCGR